MKSTELSGGCLCGVVTYQIKCPVSNVTCCHCSQCRKQTGLYYAAVELSKSSLTISGTEHLSQYRASESATREFCKVCGSALFWHADESENCHVIAGSIDMPSGLKTRRHIHCQEKGDFYELPADGVKFSAWGDV